MLNKEQVILFKKKIREKINLPVECYRSNIKILRISPERSEREEGVLFIAQRKER